jgi:hypothetical protein
MLISAINNLLTMLLPKIKSNGGKLLYMQMLQRSDDVQNLIHECTIAYGNTLYILVNVAGGIMVEKTQAGY